MPKRCLQYLLLLLQVSLEVPHKEGVRSHGIRKGKGRIGCEDRVWEGKLDISVKCNIRSIYHLLCRTFSQCVAISQVIDFDVTDVVAISNVHLTIDRACAVASSWSSWRSRLRRRACD